MKKSMQEDFMHISYTNQAENAIKYAAKKAREMQHPYIGTEHLLLGLRQEYSGVAGQILARNGVEEEKIYQDRKSTRLNSSHIL